MRHWIILDKWVIAAFLYVIIVVSGSALYEEFIADSEKSVSAAKHQSNQNHGLAEENHQSDQNHSLAVGNHEHQENQAGSKGSGHEHASETTNKAASQVNTFVQASQGEIKIFLKDKAGSPVHELEVNHEKLLHLIIVDDHLQKYYHLHPEQSGKGEFRIQYNLPDGFYKAFVDIKPKNLGYHVTPVPFIVGSPNVVTHTHDESLMADSPLTQHIDGETVKLKMSSTQANKPVKLTFDLDQTNLTPYLGAMGHVVILDEMAQEFLHVHPANQEEPVFETQFKQPGLYKIWAEFKQNGKVRAFPFLVEIKAEDH